MWGFLFLFFLVVCNTAKSMGCSKSNSKRNFQSNTCSPQEAKTISNKQSNTNPKKLEKREQMKYRSSRGKEGIKLRVEIIKIENLKAIEKIKEAKLALCRDKQNQQTYSQTHHEKKNSKSMWKRCFKRYHKRIITNYCEQLHANKLDNLEEMDIALETYNLPRLNHDKTKYLNRPITIRRLNH